MIFIDKKFRLPRMWSNKELIKFSKLFMGDVLCVSAFRDEDKEGKHYRDYFVNAKSYTITNYKTEARGFQGQKDEIYLDLEKPLVPEMMGKFDVVANHTSLEHIYDVQTAFTNLCLMTKDIVILVVPMLQEQHAENYNDYWRFTPLAIKRMAEDRGMTVLYSSFNEHKNASVYLFFILSKKPDEWSDEIHNEFTCKATKWGMTDISEKMVGCNVIKNGILTNVVNMLRDKFGG